jgi:phage gpG-like protein
VARTVRITPTGLVELRRRIEDAGPLLDRLGTIGVRAAQSAFVDQRFGAVRWSPRYATMDEPFLNIAGVVADLTAGRSTPKPNRRSRTPAGVDTGQLRMSVAHRVVDERSVQVGSTLPQASRIQFGGESRQKITRDVRHRLAVLLRKKKWKPYRERLGFLFATEEHRTSVVARPFVGVYPELAQDMVDATERWIAEGRS